MAGFRAGVRGEGWRGGPAGVMIVRRSGEERRCILIYVVMRLYSVRPSSFLLVPTKSLPLICDSGGELTSGRGKAQTNKRNFRRKIAGSMPGPNAPGPASFKIADGDTMTQMED